METIIKVAISGGWKPQYEKATELNSVIHFCEDGSILATGENGKFLEVYDKSKIVLDHLFWQALGKACGWKDLVCSFCGTEITRPASSLDDGWCRCDMKSTKAQNGWEYQALKFHEINLTESFEKAVEYLLTLIPKA